MFIIIPFIQCFFFYCCYYYLFIIWIYFHSIFSLFIYWFVVWFNYIIYIFCNFFPVPSCVSIIKKNIYLCIFCDQLHILLSNYNIPFVTWNCIKHSYNYLKKEGKEEKKNIHFTFIPFVLFIISFLFFSMRCASILQMFGCMKNLTILNSPLPWIHLMELTYYPVELMLKLMNDASYPVELMQRWIGIVHYPFELMLKLILVLKFIEVHFNL